MRCMTCGRENPDNATFCGSCGSRVGSSQLWPQQAHPLEPAKKDVKTPLIILILGIVIVAVGVIIYALAMTSAVHTVTNGNMDPWGTMDQFSADAGLIILSYAVMAIGGLIAFVGFILLILKLVGDDI